MYNPLEMLKFHPITDEDKNGIEKSRFKEFLVYDGPHALQIESEEWDRLLKAEGKPPRESKVSYSSQHKIYFFPNGYGASIARSFSSYWNWSFKEITGPFVNISKEEFAQQYHNSVVNKEWPGFMYYQGDGSEPEDLPSWDEVEARLFKIYAM